MYIFKRVSYFKMYCTFYTSKLFQLFPKNLIVIFRGQNWLIPFIVQIYVILRKIDVYLQKSSFLLANLVYSKYIVKNSKEKLTKLYII